MSQRGLDLGVWLAFVGAFLVADLLARILWWAWLSVALP